ncbi:hypothetical protein [Plebeiibacterium sediminum]|uniref:Uncharacterized protein n=1 Tax=Plebeiibacterium sediminum TaxID=2992112 RepID=A0AAE3SDL6_9BACT|nr:hypothetical protein [Plebeiobacterium sediminum]MCW3785370.1 hypothetical protein [Plebeiobacterium sediminum]
MKSELSIYRGEQTLYLKTNLVQKNKVWKLILFVEASHKIK